MRKKRRMFINNKHTAIKLQPNSGPHTTENKLYVKKMMIGNVSGFFVETGRYNFADLYMPKEETLNSKKGEKSGKTLEYVTLGNLTKKPVKFARIGTTISRKQTPHANLTKKEKQIMTADIKPM